MRKPKPKPCPFCKCADVFVERFDLCVYAVVCNGCYVNGPKVEHGKYCDDANGDDIAERDAIRMWNARTPKAHQRVLVSCEMAATSEL